MTVNAHPDVRMILDAATASDLMTANPVSIRDDATVQDAATLLTARGFSAAPVIDVAGRPVGVLSGTDIVVHERASRACATASDATRNMPVKDVMTPLVYSVGPDVTVSRVIDDMLKLHVHRLFVVGRDGILIGVITMTDVLNRLRPDQGT